MLQAGDKVPADVRIVKCTEGAEVLSFKFSTVRRNYVDGSIKTEPLRTTLGETRL